MWPYPPFAADLVTFTEEILSGKLHFLWSVFWKGSDSEEIYLFVRLSEIIFKTFQKNSNNNLCSQKRMSLIPAGITLTSNRTLFIEIAS